MPPPGRAPKTDLCCGELPLFPTDPTDLGDFYRSSIGWGGSCQGQKLHPSLGIKSQSR